MYDVIFNHSRIIGTYEELCDAVTAINLSMAKELGRIERGESSMSRYKDSLNVNGASPKHPIGMITVKGREDDDNSPYKFWHIYRHPEQP